MADKKPSPLEELERKHLEVSTALQKDLDRLTTDLREAEAMAREIRSKIAIKQQQKLANSYAYDTAVAELTAAEKAEKTKAA